MKKINQYLPFILWSVSTIILTILGFVILPIVLLWKKLQNLYMKHEVNPIVLKASELYVP